MSKILVDSEALKSAFESLLDEISQEIRNLERLRSLIADGAICNIENLEKEKHFSVLEWHHLTTVEEDGKMFWRDIPEIERCGKSKQVLVKDRHGVISAVNVDFEENQDDDGEWVSGVYPDGEDWFDYVAWAYLPE